MSHKYPLATSSWDEAEQAAIRRVIASDMYSMGPEVARFEEQFAAFMGTKHAIMCNSGSSANLLMIAALFFRRENPLQRGDEVIVPAVSWSTTYAPLQQYGLRVKFVDIDFETLNMDLVALAGAVTDRTRLIFAVNLLGNPNDFPEIERIIAGRDITLIEDNCESMGATLGGRQAGTFGLMGSYSAFFSHHISTMEGGLVVTDDTELHHIMLSLRAHGWTRNLPKENMLTGTKSDDPFEESFRFVLPGYNLRPLEMSGAIGQAQLAKLPALIAGRRANGRAFQAAMGNHPEVMIQREVGKSSWFGFSLVIRRESDWTRPALLEKLRALGFEVRPIVSGNFAKNEVLRFFDHEIHGDLANADWIDRNGLFLGNHHYPIDAAVEALRSL